MLNPHNSKKTLVLYWVRHAPTHAKTLLGWTDAAPDLSDKDALAHTRNLLPEQALVLTSDLTRTKHTADHLAALPNALGNHPRWQRYPPMAKLREMNLGTWNNKSSHTIPQNEQQQWTHFLTHPGTASAPQGESWIRFSQRIESAVQDITTTATHVQAGNVIVVTHFSVLIQRIQNALGLSARNAFAYSIPPLTVMRTDYTNNTWHWHGFL